MSVEAAALRCDSEFMAGEPGLFPTLYLTLVASLRAAAPGACLSLRVEGVDSQTLTHERLVLLEEQRLGEWTRKHGLIGMGSLQAALRSDPFSSTGCWGFTPTARPACEPLFVRVPPVPPGDYRLRLDAINNSFELRASSEARRATLYAPLRVLESPRPAGE